MLVARRSCHLATRRRLEPAASAVEHGPPEDDQDGQGSKHDLIEDTARE